MESPKALFKIIKCQAFLFGMLFGIRVATTIYVITNAGLLCAVLAGVAAALVMGWLCSDIWATKGMIAMNYMVSLVVSDVAAFAVWKIILGSGTGTFYFLWITGILSFVFMILLMAYGLLNECCVKRNEISIKSEKIKSDYKLAVISDIHYGTIQGGDVLNKTVCRINDEHPDAVLIAGDIAEEHTSKESLKELFDNLNQLETAYGVYFVHGNHDRQEKLHGVGRTYTDDEFDLLMDNAGIKCIDDKSVVINDDIQILGRADYSFAERKPVDEIIADCDKNKFKIIMEHQPVDIEKISKAEIELCLAGHYHGAQNWTNNIVYKLSGIYYNGLYKIGNMKLYVNAGIAGSKYPVRTHTHNEYLIVNVTKK